MTPSTLPRAVGVVLHTVLVSLLTLGVVVASAEASCDEIDPVEILPANDACPGWIRDGDPMTAYTIEELTLIINGEAFLYDQYGFVAAAFQNYAGEILGEPAVITLSLFNQGTAENAEALYNDPNSGQGDPVPDWSGTGAARYQTAFGFLTFQFWEDCFFASLFANSGGEDALPHARCLAEEVVAMIQSPSPAGDHTWGAVKIAYQKTTQE